MLKMTVFVSVGNKGSVLYCTKFFNGSQNSRADKKRPPWTGKVETHYSIASTFMLCNSSGHSPSSVFRYLQATGVAEIGFTHTVLSVKVQVIREQKHQNDTVETPKHITVAQGISVESVRQPRFYRGAAPPVAQILKQNPISTYSSQEHNHQLAKKVTIILIALHRSLNLERFPIRQQKQRLLLSQVDENLPFSTFQ